jgi:uncharacterized protein YciI
MKKLMTQADYAAHRRVSQPYVSKLKARGVLIMAGPLVDVTATDAVLDDKPVPGIQGAEPATLMEARRIEAVYKGKLRRQEFEEKAGELLRRADVEQTWSEAITTCRSVLLAIPANVCEKVAGESDPVVCHELLRGEVYRALETLAARDTASRA